MVLMKFLNKKNNNYEIISYKYSTISNFDDFENNFIKFFKITFFFFRILKINLKRLQIDNYEGFYALNEFICNVISSKQMTT